MSTLPTVIQQALTALELSDINVPLKSINASFKRKTTPDYFVNIHGKVESTVSLEDVARLLDAKKLLTKFINTGTFKFACANCRYKTNWDISLHIEIDNVLLCHTCQKGLERILEAKELE